MGGGQSSIKTMRKQMTSAELGYQQKELEMLFNILKNRLRGEDYPEKPGFESSGTAKALYDMFKEMESKALFYEDLIKMYYSNQDYFGINMKVKGIYGKDELLIECGVEYPENIIRIQLDGKRKQCGFSPEENPQTDFEVERNISIDKLFKILKINNDE